MKKTYLNILISVALALLVMLIVPGYLFNKHKVALISKVKMANESISFYEDLNGDRKTDQITYSRAKPGNGGNTVLFYINDIFTTLFNLSSNEFFISLYPGFADLDKNGNTEVYFLSGFEKKVYLNILEYNPSMNENLRTERYLIDSFHYYNNIPDVENYRFKFIPNKVFFELSSGFSVYPRQLFSFDIQTKELKKSPPSSVRFVDFEIVNINSEYFVLPTSNFACSNTKSPEEIIIDYSNTNKPDTIPKYCWYKKHAYEIGDFASYIMLLDENLDYVFPPVEHKQWTSNTYSCLLRSMDEPFIVSYTSASMDTSHQPTFEVVNLKGEVVKSKELSKEFYSGVVGLTVDNHILLRNGYTFNVNLENTGRYEIISPYGFIDLDKDGEKELLSITPEQLTVYNQDLKQVAAMQWHFCGKRSKLIDTFSKDGENFFRVAIGDSQFIMKYEKNALYYARIPIFVLVILIWYLFIVAVQRIYTRRLEQENKRLDEIVQERTSELNKKNEELKVFNEELNSKNNLLEEMNREKTSTMRIVAHDLKTPLDNVYSILQLIENEGADPGDHRRYFQMVYKVIESGNNLIRDLMDLSAIEEFKSSTEFTDIDADKFVENLLFPHRSKASKKDIELVLEADLVNPLFEIDTNHLRRILDNLISNAIKFSSFGKTVSVRVEDKDQEMIFSIKDEGPGFSQKDKQQLFQKFQKLSARPTNNEHSSGLGLSIVKALVDRLGGTIELVSEQGRGSEFIVKFPRNK